MQKHCHVKILINLFIFINAGCITWYRPRGVMFCCSEGNRRLPLSTPNLVHVYSIACTEPEVKRSKWRSHCYENRQKTSLLLCLSVCLFVRALKGKWLELSMPNLVHMYSLAVTRHALSQRSKGRGHMVQKP